MYLIEEVLFLFLAVTKDPLPHQVPSPQIILNLFFVNLKASGWNVTGYFHSVGTGYRSGGVATCKLLVCVPYFVLITSLKIISAMLETPQGCIKPCDGIRWREMLEIIMIGATNPLH